MERRLSAVANWDAAIVRHCAARRGTASREGALAFATMCRTARSFNDIEA